MDERPPRAISAVIFDMDGLMVDTEPLARRGWELALAPLGAELDEATYRAMIGLRADESGRVLVRRLGLAHDPVAITRAAKDHLRGLMAKSVPIMPGLMPLFEVIAALDLPWAVATSSPRRVAEYVLKKLALAEACGAVAGGDEVLLGKPAPDVYLLAAERLGVSPAGCLALEDSVPGAQSALAAGMTVVVVPGPEAEPGAFAGAWRVLPSLTAIARQLPEWLDRV